MTMTPPATGTGVATAVRERIRLNPLSSAVNCSSPDGEVSSLANTENGVPAAYPGLSSIPRFRSQIYHTTNVKVV